MGAVITLTEQDGVFALKSLEPLKFQVQGGSKEAVVEAGICIVREKTEQPFVNSEPLTVSKVKLVTAASYRQLFEAILETI